jgi:choline-phosphate cytidylyltransferase
MKKVITYGTYDLLHYGHIRLLERAKALGDYLIVGVTSDDFDKTRGKINAQQTLMERMEAVRATGLADEIIVEEYEGQKIDDIIRMQVDIFTVGSDWEGYFDYLKDYCEVIYLERTEGISSSKLREQKRSIRLGLVGGSNYLNKVATEVSYVNGIDLSGIYTDSSENLSNEIKSLPIVTDNYSELLNNSDAVYIHSHPKLHYLQVKKALEAGKHVMCESPLAMSKEECNDLFRLAENNGCILMDTLRTAYATAFQRILLLVKGGRIGKVVSVDAVCTSLRDMNIQNENAMAENWNSITAWGPTALLPIFQILGTNYREKKIISHFSKNAKSYDTFSKIDFIYDEAVASIKVGVGVKSEGVLIISGTKGYVYVPAPWWKTDYFEIRYENPANNRKYFYQLDGEGIRYEFASFAKATENGKLNLRISKEITESICTIMEHFEKRIDHISI